LIAAPFSDGLTVVFTGAAVMALIAAAASALRGGRFVHEERKATSLADADRSAGRTQRTAAGGTQP
jgi:hypothetical protein